MSIGIPLHENTFTTWAARAAYFEQLRTTLEETPGVTMTAISSNATPPENGHKERFDIQGKPKDEDQMQALNFVNSSYFATLRIPLLQGRVWSQSEDLGGAPVAVINETMARRFFPKGDALAHSIRLPGIDDRPPTILAAPHIADAWLPIVGIVADAKNDGLKNPVFPAVYVPYTLRLAQGTQILVRSQVEPMTLLNQFRKSVSSVNRDQQVDSNVDDLENWLADDPSWRQQHLVSWIFGIFSALALALAAVGLYSVVSYSVVQRTNEFGVRMALGAPRGHITRLVFASTAASVGSGILAGLALTLVMDRVLSAWMEGSPHDPLVLLAGIVLLSLVLVASCAIPARHASQVDPMTALRCD
jgi:predicted permease